MHDPQGWEGGGNCCKINFCTIRLAIGTNLILRGNKCAKCGQFLKVTKLARYCTAERKKHNFSGPVTIFVLSQST
jgi:hypothetical protein